jgi:quinol monooxygenase YgiN
MRFVVKMPSAQTLDRFGWRAPVLAGSLLIAIASCAQAQTGDAAVYAATYVDVAAPLASQGVDLIKAYRDLSRKEGSNLEFTVLQETSRPNRFVIFEGWKDQAAYDAHVKASSTTQFLEGLTKIRNSPPDRHMLHTFAVAPSRSEPAPGSLYMVEHVDFLPSFGVAAQPLVKAVAESSQRDSGTLRYDVYQQPAPRINHYTVVGVWPNAKAFDAHENSAHTRQFRGATVMPEGRANLYDQRLYRVL